MMICDRYGFRGSLGTGVPGPCKLATTRNEKTQMSRKLRVAIDCRMPDSRQGVGTAVLALAKALSDSEVTDQEYTFIVHENMRSWLAPYVYGPCKLEGIPESKLSATKAALRRVAPLRFLWKQFKGTRVQLLNSDG